MKPIVNLARWILFIPMAIMAYLLFVTAAQALAPGIEKALDFNIFKGYDKHIIFSILLFILWYFYSHIYYETGIFVAPKKGPEVVLTLAIFFFLFQISALFFYDEKQGFLIQKLIILATIYMVTVNKYNESKEKNIT
jgi:hypothetical protein